MNNKDLKKIAGIIENTHKRCIYTETPQVPTVTLATIKNETDGKKIHNSDINCSNTDKQSELFLTE